jgi:hypothetical protein
MQSPFLALGRTVSFMSLLYLTQRKATLVQTRKEIMLFLDSFKIWLQTKVKVQTWKKNLQA